MQAATLYHSYVCFNLCEKGSKNKVPVEYLLNTSDQGRSLASSFAGATSASSSGGQPSSEYLQSETPTEDSLSLSSSTSSFLTSSLLGTGARKDGSRFNEKSCTGGLRRALQPGVTFRPRGSEGSGDRKPSAKFTRFGTDPLRLGVGVGGIDPLGGSDEGEGENGLRRAPDSRVSVRPRGGGGDLAGSSSSLASCIRVKMFFNSIQSVVVNFLRKAPVRGNRSSVRSVWTSDIVFPLEVA